MSKSNLEGWAGAGKSFFQLIVYSLLLRNVSAGTPTEQEPQGRNCAEATRNTAYWLALPRTTCPEVEPPGGGAHLTNHQSGKCPQTCLQDYLWRYFLEQNLFPDDPGLCRAGIQTSQHEQ